MRSSSRSSACSPRTGCYNGAHYSERDIFGSPSFRPGPIVAWAAGFLVYEWLYQPTGLGFWSDLMAKLPTPEYQIGASLPSFALAFVLTGLFQILSSPRATVTAEPPTSTRSTSSAEPSTRA